MGVSTSEQTDPASLLVSAASARTSAIGVTMSRTAGLVRHRSVASQDAFSRKSIRLSMQCFDRLSPTTDISISTAIWSHRIGSSPCVNSVRPSHTAPLYSGISPLNSMFRNSSGSSRYPCTNGPTRRL